MYIQLKQNKTKSRHEYNRIKINKIIISVQQEFSHEKILFFF